MRIIIVIGIVLITSCDLTSEQNAKQQPGGTAYAELYAPTNYDVAGIDNLDSVVNYLGKASVIDDGHVGIAGSQSTTYAHYIRLKELASDSILENLIQHDNPVVRVYAYWALIERNYSKKTALMQVAANDSSSVKYMSGCIMMPEPVISVVKSKWNEFNPPVK